MKDFKFKTRVLKPNGMGFGHYINCYNGCEHGCRYCYGMERTHKERDIWILPQPRLKLLKDLQHDIKLINDDSEARDLIKDIMLCSITDCYQPLEQTHHITRDVIKVLKDNDLPFTVLTKSHHVTDDDDIGLFRGYDKCRVGLTIVTLNDEYGKQLEPGASLISERVVALKKLKDAKIRTYCSVEPIMPDPRSNPIRILEELGGFVDLFEFGKFNPNGNDDPDFNREIYIEKFKQIDQYCSDHPTINYCHAGHSRNFLLNNGLGYKPSLPLLDYLATGGNK